MRLLISMFLIFSCGILLAQDTIRYDMLNEGVNVRGTYDAYLDKNGDLYEIGDTLLLGRPVGDSRAYMHVQHQVGLETKVAEVSSAGSTIVIRAIRVAGSRRAGYAANFRTTGHSGLDNFWIAWEPALELGEVIGKGISRDQAINKLTEAKQLLDLEIITQEEYDELREELTPIIRGDR